MEEHAAYGIGFTSTLHPEAVQVRKFAFPGSAIMTDFD